MPLAGIWTPLQRHLGRLHRAVQLVWRITPSWTLLNLGLVFVQGALPLLSLYVMKCLVDAVATGMAAHDLREVYWWVAAAGGAALLTIIARALSDLGSEVQSQVVTDTISDILHQQSLAIDLAYYEDPGYYDTLHRAQQEAPYRPTQIVRSLISLGQNAISLLGIAGLLLAYDWRLAVLIFAIALPGALVRLVYARRAYALQMQQTEEERHASYVHTVLTSAYFAKELRLFDIGAIFRRQFREIRDHLRVAKLRLNGRRVWSDALMQGMATLAIFGALGFIASQAVIGAITVGAMVMYYQSFQMGFSALQGALRGVTTLYEHSLFLYQFDAFLALQPSVQAQPPVEPLPAADATSGVCVTGVSFRYPQSRHWALQEIDLELKPGQVIALVGDNGSGKSTLAKLLCRLYDPSAGQISYAGVDLRRVEPQEWRRQISVVFQDYVHYCMTARENISLGATERTHSDAEIVAAAEAAGADAAIRRLPQGYDTMLGMLFAGGQELSTGEWQKVAVARAFLRESSIVILDEPSSALDPIAEADLFARFRTLIAGRSAVLISHRFSTVQIADCIYVMEGGRIVERGSHAELMALDGKYAYLYRTQAASYQDDAFLATTTGG